jgi:hypothetical protein
LDTAAAQFVEAVEGVENPAKLKSMAPPDVNPSAVPENVMKSVTGNVVGAVRSVIVPTTPASKVPTLDVMSVPAAESMPAVVLVVVHPVPPSHVMLVNVTVTPPPRQLLSCKTPFKGVAEANPGNSNSPAAAITIAALN